MKKTLLTGTVAALVLASAVVLAMRHHDDDDADENTVVTNAAVDLGGAVRAAVIQAGGTAMEADTESEHGKSYYEVKVHTDHGISEVRVDPTTGKVLGKKSLTDTPREKALGDKATADGRSLTLSDAVASAEGRLGGKATEAGIDVNNGHMTYHVELAQGDERMDRVTVNARDGSVERSSTPEHEADREHEHEAESGLEHEDRD